MEAERRCEHCGQMIPWGERKCPACGDDRGFLWSVTRKELLLISAVLLVIMFALTTFSVKAYHAKERQLAEQWYAAGDRELKAGHAAKAIGDFRSALIYSRNDSRVELELVQALAAAHHPSEARAYLLGLWESEPGNGTLNLELARLSAQSGLSPAAVRTAAGPRKQFFSSSASLPTSAIRLQTRSRCRRAGIRQGAS